MIFRVVGPYLDVNQNTQSFVFPFFFFKDFIYLLMRDTEREREAETQAGGEAGSMQGA